MSGIFFKVISAKKERGKGEEVERPDEAGMALNK